MLIRFPILTTLLASTLILAACSERPKIASVQRFYGQGAPHTDREGQARTTYDPERSFLPIAIYHALSGEHHGFRFDFGDLSEAGFNAVHLWERQAPETLLKQAHAANLQLIVHWPDEESVTALSGRPGLLAWYLDEEPSFLYPPGETEQRLKSFRKDRAGCESCMAVMSAAWFVEFRQRLPWLLHVD